jgi:pyruvate/2-oxoacid:ferredoxin oxidoreductase beta subunit
MAGETGGTRLLAQLGIETPAVDYLASGHTGCTGCGAALPIKYAMKVMGERSVVITPPSCASGIMRSIRVSYMPAALAAAAAFASGVKQGLELTGDWETEVIAYAGDGGTFDIGLQSLSAAVERNERILYICYDNEAYMNTGIQRSGATPLGAWTGTSPSKGEPKKDIMAILAAHGIPYAATVSIAYPEDFLRKLERAKGVKGTRFFHVLAACPTGWRFPPDLTVRVARLAVQSKVAPLFEIEGGEYARVQKPRVEVPVRDYLSLQARFNHLTEEQIDLIQEAVDRAWERLLARAHTVEELPY